MIESCASNRHEVISRYPRAPVLVQPPKRFVAPERLTEGILIDYTSTVFPLIEQRRRDPWLQHEPSPEIDTSDLVIGVIEGEGLTLGSADEAVSADDLIRTTSTQSGWRL